MPALGAPAIALRLKSLVPPAREERKADEKEGVDEGC
jgi:hypothetical protein